MRLKMNKAQETIDIATGRSRKETKWRNISLTWEALAAKLSTTQVTHETHAEYMTMSKTRQDEVKDVGGFVGAYLANGRRKARNVSHRQLVTLDADFASKEFWGVVTLNFNSVASLVYSTHKHTPERPRLRLLMPLDREVSPEEYEAISRYIAGVINIDWFDPTTFQPERLMYWPSTPKDIEYYYREQEGDWLCADEVLATYHDWRDTSAWPVSAKVGQVISKAVADQEDPLSKDGVVGAFCRTYSITEALETFLADAYEPCDIEGRYTFTGGSTSAGMIVYDDIFAFSHHGTDPICGKLCNAFDLVRLHKFGQLDDRTPPQTRNDRVPSYLKMLELATQDKETRLTLHRERAAQMVQDFAGLTEYTEDEGEGEVETSDDWKADLEVDKHGNILATIPNVKIILENDPKIKGRIAKDLFSQKPCVLKALPWDAKAFKKPREWEDEDLSSLKNYLCTGEYGLSVAKGVEDLLADVRRANAYHPVKDYLNDLVWDGIERLDTMLVDYLGAEDNAFNRAVTRKTLVGAVKRIYEPGCQFDYVLTCVGEEGNGKSTLARKLGGDWYNGSFSFNDMKHVDKAIERIQGYWIIEIPDLSGINKAQAEDIKAFITNVSDNSRKAYGRETLNKRRQCIFLGNSNDFNFLKNNHGNRRFWPVPVQVQKPKRSIFKMDSAEIGQIWAEACYWYFAGEPVFLDKALEAEARQRQSFHTEEDPRLGQIVEFLDRKLPADWYDRPISDRVDYMNYGYEGGTLTRDAITVPEIWCECFGHRRETMDAQNVRPIHRLLEAVPGWVPLTSKSRFAGYGHLRTFARIDRSTPVTSFDKNLN